MPFLRQSTSQVILFGPCLDITNGVTEETALTLAQADMRLSKDGGAFAQKSAAGNATHDSDGWYSTTLSTTDTATVGELILNVHQPANMLPVWQRWWVIEEAVYDAMYGAAAEGPLQGTTAGNTLDVNATGEAGLDLDNTSGTIAAAQIATDAITNAKIAADAIGATEIANGAIDAATFAAGAIDAAALATDAVTEIANAMLPKINTALNDIPFVMVDATDGLTLETGLTVTATKSLNGTTAFSATTGTVTEIANGVYSFDASAADMNGALVVFKFAATGAANAYVTIRTSA